MTSRTRRQQNDNAGKTLSGLEKGLSLKKIRSKFKMDYNIRTTLTDRLDTGVLKTNAAANSSVSQYVLRKQ